MEKLKPQGLKNKAKNPRNNSDTGSQNSQARPVTAPKSIWQKRSQSVQNRATKAHKKELSETSLEEIKEKVNMKDDSRIRFDLTLATSSNEPLLKEVIRANGGQWRICSKRANLAYVFSKLDDSKLV